MNAITEHRSLADGFADEAIESFSRSHVHIIDTMNRLRVLPQPVAAQATVIATSVAVSHAWREGWPL